jgi:hypothetical protein
MQALALQFGHQGSGFFFLSNYRILHSKSFSTHLSVF